MTPEKKIVRLEEFLQMDKENEHRFEYFDGEVVCLESPSVEHQRVLLNIAAEFRNYFRGKSCEVFISPLDVWLTNEEKTAKVKVQPDLIVITDKSGLKENEYTGLSTLIVEVISISNQSHDRIRKYNTYMEFGIKEYWIINPKLKTIEVYILEEDEYKQAAIYKGDDCAVSQTFKELKIHLNEIF
ncbi:Endonuclease, Uma2 family (restriction endonuclease fold) [Geosporobacter subterraneus DSM 17957]|jgi:Uma2 family endonuclease|uniref:Endonuclease, Uma2 family (Restriction endonuclease fold) n=1 Tax=Geosporobacter subterraneus DSM 17957 TaxID=1121919 RepID=A0A1M6NP57_9FIRM|nr:Uma2 family endonuclease [Geosporobacter subterraneus]SHJ97352.1 Endonuclease, Uma2 family (restriction endonuclease fold) [Geosporobacter subterraneus DSM 17957]